MDSDQKLPTRFQILQELTFAKPFEVNPEGRTFNEFRKLAEAETTEQDSYAEIEKEYWQCVDNQIGKRRQLEYAADVPTDVFGSGFGRPGQKIIHKEQKKYD